MTVLHLKCEISNGQITEAIFEIDDGDRKKRLQTKREAAQSVPRSCN
jgi:hypothetical protein